MNNGKVRIYDLSKELNLDNKELLAICDQLSISVKSHSSTITETEAEHIRAAAENQTAQGASSHKEANVTSPKANPQAVGIKPKPNIPHKPQILEIRRPKTLDRANQNSLESQQVASSPQPPVGAPSSPRPYSSPAPIKPTAPVRQVRTSPPETIPDVTEVGAGNLEQRNLEQKTDRSPELPLDLSIEETEQLAGPPVRPVIQKLAPTPTLSQSERPLLKRDQPPLPRRNQPVETTSDAPDKPAPRPIALRSSESTPRPQAPDVQRPRTARLNDAGSPISIRPKTGVGTGDQPSDTEEETDGGVLLDSSEELLERPTLPRPIKGPKKWKEEEIDEGQDSAKAGKLGAKGKRLKPITDIDEEDLDDSDLNIDAAIKVSLSIARPPKQKAARTGQSLPTIAALPTAAVRGKKSGSSSREQNQNRRREAEQKPDRPEKLVITGPMTVQELAEALAVQDTEIVRILFLKSMAVNITQNLDIPTITLVTKELGVELETAEPEAEARKVTEMVDAADMEFLQRRPPVVTIMGHVDHGKTTLLDSIRKTKVAAGEAGGITQHIGAYHVDVEHEGKMQQVIFLDTPGHEAFTAMRARGARVTDLAILVVAADDGVRPQTIEAISHAQAAEVPIIVAINKIDKEGAQPDRVMQELTQYGLTAEKWGGETIMVAVSALKGENLDMLLEMILLVTEVEELSANPDRLAKGTVIEAHLDKAKGPVATLLIQNGTLRVGDVLVAGSAFGKVRAMVDDRGRRVEIATPSFAVEVLGLSDVPAAGDEFEVFENEKEARSLSTERAMQQRQSRLLQGRITLTTLSAQAQEGELKELNLILKADVQGSVEAIVNSLKQIPQNEVQIRLLLSAPGEITETDIDLASASNAVIIGFNTTLASGARQAADEAGVDVREYNIIYKLLEDIQGALEGLLEPELVEEPLGQAEMRTKFAIGRGAVAGCYVLSGKIVRNCKVRVRRGSKVVYEGTVDSVKRMKDDVREVNSGYECGIGIDKFADWIEGDIIEAFQMVTKRRTLTMTR